jgi:hypothetical protein
MEPDAPLPVYLPVRTEEARESVMRGGLLWLLGIPLPVIILLYLFHVI